MTVVLCVFLSAKNVLADTDIYRNLDVFDWTMFRLEF
jgi:hypothetical protein